MSPTPSKRGSRWFAESRTRFVCLRPARPVRPCCWQRSRTREKDGDPDSKLLRKYQPVLVFHPDEQFRPMKVQGFVEDSELERFVWIEPAAASARRLLDSRRPGPGARRSSPLRLRARSSASIRRAARPTPRSPAATATRRPPPGRSTLARRAMYGRVVQTETHIVLQYWLFYYDNPFLLPPTPFGTFWQSHEGDWEVVNVVLGTDQQPLEAAYSQHCSGQRRAWDAVTKSPAESTHAVAYVAFGSHANYFAPGADPLGTIPISATCIPPGPLRRSCRS